MKKVKFFLLCSQRLLACWRCWPTKPIMQCDLQFPKTKNKGSIVGSGIDFDPNSEYRCNLHSVTNLSTQKELSNWYKLQFSDRFASELHEMACLLTRRRLHIVWLQVTSGNDLGNPGDTSLQFFVHMSCCGATQWQWHYMIH